MEEKTIQNEKRKRDVLIVFNNSMANYMINKGFNIIKVEDHRTEKGKSVYIYEKTNSSFEAYKEYINFMKERKSFLNSN